MSTLSSDTLLKVEHLSMKFGGLMAINDFSFEAKRGDITALIGPNGAGKTTVFNCITGFYKPTMGMITMNQKSGKTYQLERLPDFRITREAKVVGVYTWKEILKDPAADPKLFPGDQVYVPD